MTSCGDDGHGTGHCSLSVEVTDDIEAVGVCTLATCKPRIGKGAIPEDRVVGIGSVQNQLEGRLGYTMRVDEKLTFEYWADPRFGRRELNESNPTGPNGTPKRSLPPTASPGRTGERLLGALSATVA